MQAIIWERLEPSPYQLISILFSHLAEFFGGCGNLKISTQKYYAQVFRKATFKCDLYPCYYIIGLYSAATYLKCCKFYLDIKCSSLWIQINASLKIIRNLKYQLCMWYRSIPCCCKVYQNPFPRLQADLRVSSSN